MHCSSCLKFCPPEQPELHRLLKVIPRWAVTSWEVFLLRVHKKRLFVDYYITSYLMVSMAYRWTRKWPSALILSQPHSLVSWMCGKWEIPTPRERGLVGSGTWCKIAVSCAWDDWDSRSCACQDTPWASPSCGGQLKQSAPFYENQMQLLGSWQLVNTAFA